ncbi:MAG: toll/interleukin-1 receptor domain-containing protein [Candidatus Electrothrix sp. Rat3]|nr:toll/interleukin-1 receptor domain-containing protein [Candidatus Electrothrix rattekaaiensis]
MATIREFFDTDIKDMTKHNDWGMTLLDGSPLPSITAKIAWDFDANAKYWSFFIPDGVDISGCVNSLFKLPEMSRCVLSEGDGLFVESGFAGYSEKMRSKSLVFTGRVFFYIDAWLELSERKKLTNAGSQYGFHVIVRDREYAKVRSRKEKPVAFISHDSKDKDSLVRNLVLELSKLRCIVWYDEYALKVGESLRASIEKGLKETKKCVVVLSPNFLSNEGWGKVEFDSVFTREIIEKDNVMLPIWHNVSVQEVYEYSPKLADKVGLNSDMGIEKLATKLKHAIAG